MKIKRGRPSVYRGIYSADQFDDWLAQHGQKEPDVILEGSRRVLVDGEATVAVAKSIGVSKDYLTIRIRAVVAEIDGVFADWVAVRTLAPPELAKKFNALVKVARVRAIEKKLNPSVEV
jgi:hypothetical protein